MERLIWCRGVGRRWYDGNWYEGETLVKLGSGRDVGIREGRWYGGGTLV